MANFYTSDLIALDFQVFSENWVIYEDSRLFKLNIICYLKNEQREL